MKTAGPSGPVGCGDRGQGKIRVPAWTAWVWATFPLWCPLLVCSSLTTFFFHLTLRLFLFMDTSLWQNTPKSHVLCIPWGERDLLFSSRLCSFVIRDPDIYADLVREGYSGHKPNVLTTCTGTLRCCCATTQSKRQSVCMKTPAATKTATKRKRRRKKSWIKVWSL